MKYFLEKIQVFEDMTSAKEISEVPYTSRDTAEKDFCYAMFSSMQNPDIIFVRCAVLNEIGGVEFSDSDLKPVVMPEGEEFPKKYYLARIIISTNDAVTAHDLFDYDTEELAKEAYYSYLSQAIDVVGNKSVMCLVQDMEGNEIKRRYWPDAQ